MTRGVYNRKFNAPSSPHQRLYIRCLMDELELPWDYITTLNFRVFDAAGIPRPEAGARGDAALEALTRQQACDLIAVLKKEVDDG